MDSMGLKHPYDENDPDAYFEWLTESSKDLPKEDKEIVEASKKIYKAHCRMPKFKLYKKNFEYGDVPVVYLDDILFLCIYSAPNKWKESPTSSSFFEGVDFVNGLKELRERVSQFYTVMKDKPKAMKEIVDNLIKEAKRDKQDKASLEATKNFDKFFKDIPSIELTGFIGDKIKKDKAGNIEEIEHVLYNPTGSHYIAISKSVGDQNTYAVGKLEKVPLVYFREGIDAFKQRAVESRFFSTHSDEKALLEAIDVLQALNKQNMEMNDNFMSAAKEIKSEIDKLFKEVIKPEIEETDHALLKRLKMVIKDAATNILTLTSFIEASNLSIGQVIDSAKKIIDVPKTI